MNHLANQFLKRCKKEYLQYTPVAQGMGQGICMQVDGIVLVNDEHRRTSAEQYKNATHKC